MSVATLDVPSSTVTGRSARAGGSDDSLRQPRVHQNVGGCWLAAPMATPTPPDHPTRVAAPAGYDPLFLSAGLPVPLPVPPASAAVRELPSTHFTVVLNVARRLAVATGVNLDGSALLDLDRGDDWHLDTRVPADQQTGPDVYANNDLDRGHLVRRRDSVWGPGAVAAQANFDTFTYTNAAPQAALFNQGRRLWAGLEDYVLDHARTYAQRLSVFSAPVLDPADPPYRGIRIPLRFWKIAAWAQTPDPADPAESAAPDGGGSAWSDESDEARMLVAATGYVLDQTPQLDDIDLATARALAVGSPPPLGPFRTFQVPIADIATLTGLDLGPLTAADRFPAQATAGELTPAAATATGRWRPLAAFDDITL